MSDPTLFEREVEEDLRQDQLTRLWKTYGPWMLAGVVGALGISAGVIFYQNQQASAQAQSSAAYEAALNTIRDGAPMEGLAAFRVLGEQGGGYGALARLREASLLSTEAEIDAAVRAYEAIASDGSVDRVLRDLAALKASYLQADREDPETFAARIAAQRRPDNAWSPFLTELSALADMRRGDRTAAYGAFAVLRDDPDAPSGLRTRAEQLAAFLAPPIDEDHVQEGPEVEETPDEAPVDGAGELDKGGTDDGATDGAAEMTEAAEPAEATQTQDDEGQADDAPDDDTQGDDTRSDEGDDDGA